MLADHLQELQAWLLRVLFLLLQQAVINQGGNEIQCGGADIPGSRTDGLRCFQRTAPREDTEAAQELLLLPVQQLISPGDGISQGPLAGAATPPSPRPTPHRVVPTPQQAAQRGPS